MIRHLPPHSPSWTPRGKHTSTYLQERRDKKINDCTLNYITTYRASAPLCFLWRRRNTTSYLHNVRSSLLRFRHRGLISSFITDNNTKSKKPRFRRLYRRQRLSLVLFIHCMCIYQDPMKRLSLCYITKDKVSLKGAYNLESAPAFNQGAIKTRYKCLFVKWRVMTARSKLLGTKGREQKPEWMTSGIAGSIMLHILLPFCPTKRGES